MGHSIWLLLIVLAHLSVASKLNVPRVLLPFSEEGTQFILSSDDSHGCFKWKSSRPELVSIKPIDEDVGRGCSSTAAISASSKSWIKAQSIITAEDVNSPGHLLRCDVIVDVIHSLQIVTKTHELFLEEAPEEFIVRAYDDQGNEFTTVEKIIFVWSIDNIVKKSGSTSHGDHHVRFINFRDSTYAFDDTLKEIESSGKQGYKVLLEGIKTGSSRVSVRLASSGVYSKVSPAVVNVMVVANLYLVPSSAYVMIGASVIYYGEQIKSNKLYKINLPSQQYLLETETTEFVSLKEATVTGLKLGSTEIVLRDTNLAPDDNIPPPLADVHVVTPSYITLTVKPHKNWNVIVGKDYSIVVDIFDGDNNKIYPSDNIVIEINVASEYFNVEKKLKNGTIIYGKPIKVGTAEVRATLIGVRDQYGKIIPLSTPLRASGDLEIFNQIVLQPDLSVFPWDPVTHAVYTLDYKIEGFEGISVDSFIWTTSNNSVASVNQNGIAKTIPYVSIGQTYIRAAMKKASHNFGDAMILVLPAGGLQILNQVHEVEIGNALPLPLNLYGYNEGVKMFFTNCEKIPFDIEISDKKVLKDTGNNLENENMKEMFSQSEIQPCCAPLIKGISEGFSKVKAYFSYTSFNSQVVELFDEMTISSYKPLMPVQPFKGEALLSVDSTLDLVWSGGPLPWYKKPENHFHELKVSDSSILKVEDRRQVKGTNDLLFIFEVKCLEHGEVTAELSVGNKKSRSLPNPVVVSSKITVRCGKPDQLELQPDIPQPIGTVSPCPLTAKTGRIAALANENLLIKVTVLDSSGRKFDNISSLEIDWSLSKDNKGQLKIKSGTEYISSLEQKFLGYRHIQDAYQTLLTNGNSGVLDIKALLRKSSSIMGFGTIEDNLEINLVKDASLETSVISVFNHPLNRETVQAIDGSGFFEVVGGTNNVLEAKYVVSNQSIVLRPLGDGDITLIVRDLCLQAKKSPNLRVHVSGVHKVELVMNDKVQRGKVINAQVKLLDRHGQQLAPSALKFLKIAPTVSSNIVRIRPNESAQPSDLMFIVKGDELGDSSVTATAKFGVHTTSSIPSPIQVFPPLKIEPRNLTLIIGAKFQVNSLGGPQPDSNIEFSLNDERIAISNLDGLIEAKILGSTKLIARAVGIDRISNSKVIYSFDEVDVHVVKMDGIRIQTPLQKISVGSEMPVIAMGTDENQNPYSFGSAIPHLEFTWSVEPQDVVDLNNVYYRNNLNQGKENNGIMRLVAKKSGRVTIKLKVKISKLNSISNQFQLFGNQEFTHEIQIQVFDNLKLLKPQMVANNVLMSPHSQFQLRTNREPFGTMSYTILDDNKIISVSRTGLVKTGNSIGSATILIEDTEDFGIVQRMVVGIEVKQINYMMINVDKSFSPNPNTIQSEHLPRGMDLYMHVSYHDNTGHKFDATNEDSSFRPSRFDTMNILEDKNNSLISELLREEYTVLKVESTNKGRNDLQDFIIMKVGPGITPYILNNAIVGSVVDLDNLIINYREESESGRWIAEPNDLVSIDEKTGIATMLRSGHARISYFINDKQKTSLDLSIKPSSKITIPKITYLASKKEKQFVKFIIQSEIGNEKTNFMGGEMSDLITTTSLFDCQARFINNDLNLKNYFDVKTVFNFEIQSYACQFTPKSNLFTSKSSVITGEIELTVSPVHGFRAKMAEERITFDFIAGFHPLSEKLELTSQEPGVLLEVQGLNNVLSSITVDPSDEKYIAIGSSYMSDNDIRVFPIHLKYNFWNDLPRKDLYITLSSSITKDSVKIPVSITIHPNACVNGELGWSSLLHFLLSRYQAILSMIVISVASVMASKYVMTNNLNSKDNQTANGGAPGKKLIGSPPPKSSILLSPGAQSPTSLNLTNADNKPYLWSVDNSPIYGSPPIRRSPRSLTNPYNNY